MTGALVAGSLVALTASVPAAAFGDSTSLSCSVPSVAATTPDTQLTSLFAAYGQSRSGWSGGDGTYSVVLPDGTTAWFFSDSDITIAPAKLPTLVHNSIVVESSAGSLTQTLFGYMGKRKVAYINPVPFSTAVRLWPLGEIVSGGDLSVVLTKEHWIRGTDVQWLGSEVATLSLPSLQVQSIVPISATTINWGQWLMQGDDGYTYIYGIAGASAYVARLPTGDPVSDQAQWTYFDGTAWNTDQASAAPITSDVEAEYSVSQVGSAYVLVTMDESNFFDGYVDVSFGCSPEGPFGDTQQVYTAPQVNTKKKKIYAYEAHIQPQFTSESASGQTTITLSYNVNTLGGPPQVSIYRPTFLNVTLNPP